MRILFFGTYDARSHPRVAVLRDGLRAHGHDVAECNVPLDLDTAARVRMLRRPWLLPRFLLRLAAAWWRLWRGSRRIATPGAVVVGYLGHFDVHLARRLWPRVPLVLDHLVSARDTAADRGADGSLLGRALGQLDRRALAAADVRVVDTEEQLTLVPADLRPGAVVARVGAAQTWFREPRQDAAGDAAPANLRVVFFGLFTPLQGAPTIGAAIGSLADEPRIQFTMIGSGQDHAATQQLAAANPHVDWRPWVPAEELPATVAEHDVCLGIFGTGPKAQRVVPTKVHQGAAAGCAIVTSDTQPQRRAFGGSAELVAAGDPAALAQVLRELLEDPDRLRRARRAAFERARAEFAPARVVEPLLAKLEAEHPETSAAEGIRA